MRYISWDWFLYVIVGFIVGGGCAYLHAYLKVKAEKLNILEKSLTVLICVTFILMWQTVIGSLQEDETRVAWLTLVFVGLPLAIMVVGLVRSFTKRRAISS